MTSQSGSAGERRFQPGRWLLGRGWWVLPALLSAAISIPWVCGERWYSDAPYYQAIATQMAREGTWLSPMQGDIPYFNKPPLAFWGHAVLVLLFGEANWAAHAPEAVTFIAMCVLIAWIVRRFHGPLPGVIAGCVMALTNDWIIRVGNFKLDGQHTLLLFAAIACWLMVLIPEESSADPALHHAAPRRRSWKIWCIAAGVALGAALLTKPFYALAVPVFMTVWLAATRRLTARVAGMLGSSSLVGIALAAPWYAWMIVHHGQAFVRAHVHEQTVERAMGRMHDAQDWMWYIRLIEGTIGESVEPAKMWPIYTAAIAGIVCLGLVWGRRSERDGGLLAAFWLVGWFIALSLFGGKRNYYLMMLHPATAWLAAIFLATIIRCAAKQLGEAITMRVLRGAAVLGLLAAVALMIRSPIVVARQRSQLDVPERVELMSFLRSQHAAGRTIYDCGLSYRIAALSYIQAGVWPKVPSERTAFTPDAIPAGGLMAYAADQLAKAAYGTFVDPRDTLVFRSSPSGQYLVYERHATVATPQLSPTPQLPSTPR